jgi:hypothetical protein
MARPSLPPTLPEAHALIEALWARLEALEAKVDGLQRQLGQNLTNSSWSPSSDGPKSERAKPLANQARALVVNGGLSPHEATALLLETACSILLTKPALSYERWFTRQGERSVARSPDPANGCSRRLW